MNTSPTTLYDGAGPVLICRAGAHPSDLNPAAIEEVGWAEPQPTESSGHDRFWARVSVAENVCWIWTGRLEENGYGRFQLLRRRYRVHRFAYEMLVGPIPDGLELDHLCRNRACVNPTHLEPVTHQTNVLRGINQAGANATKALCHRGHPFDLLNTYFPPGGRRRQCRACLRCADERRRARERRRS